MKIIIPSMSRSESIITHKLLNDYLVCVPTSQVETYKKTIPAKNITNHPDNIIGLAAKRNWIVNHYMDDECIVMLDDDIDALFCFLTEDQILKPDHIEEVIYKTYLAAKEMGVFLFGWAGGTKPVIFKEYFPFRITGYINGFAMGVINGFKLRWDEQNIKEDYDICLMNAYKHRMIFKNEMYAFSQIDTMMAIGGLSQFRTVEKEKEGIMLLRKKYGRNVIGRKKAHGKKNTDVPQLAINLPF